MLPRIDPLVPLDDTRDALELFPNWGIDLACRNRCDNLSKGLVTGAAEPNAIILHQSLNSGLRTLTGCFDTAMLLAYRGQACQPREWTTFGHSGT